MSKGVNEFNFISKAFEIKKWKRSNKKYKYKEASIWHKLCLLLKLVLNLLVNRDGIRNALF